MRQALQRIERQTRGQGFYPLTPEIVEWVAKQGFATGLLTVFCRHTSASLLIQENADPDVRTDMLRFLQRIAPESRDYVHSDEGPDDMPAHLRTLLTQTTLSIPLDRSCLVLGTWQGIYLAEHRTRPHRREVVLHLIGN